MDEAIRIYFFIQTFALVSVLITFTILRIYKIRKNEKQKLQDEALKWCFEKLKPKYCQGRYFHCDDCPMSDIGDWDKKEGRPNRKQSLIICKEKRYYSK